MVAMTSTELGLTVVFSVIIVINLVGNGFVCLVVLRYRRMRAPINYLLVNLAVSDMMVAFAIAPQYVIKWAFHHPNGTAGDYICKFITGGNFIWIGGVASAFSLVVIAVERYFAIVSPLSDRRRLTTCGLTAVLAAGWSFALMYNLPLFFVIKHKNGVNHCREQWPNKTLAEVFTIACLFAYGVIPISIMACLYSRVLYKLWKGGVNATQLSDQARIRARLKVTKMVVVVSVMYAVCWLPNLVIYMLSQFKRERFDYGSYAALPTFTVSVVLVGLNSAMNPFIYTLHSTKFRQHLRLALSCKGYRPLDLTETTDGGHTRSSSAGIFGSGNY